MEATNPADELQKLREEIDALSAQVAQQQRFLLLAKERLQNLSSGPFTDAGPRPMPSSPLKAPSLENLIGLRLIHLVGMVVLVIGLSLGVKYAIDKNLISEGMRIALAYAAGFALYLLSALLKKKYSSFSAILFSGAAASLYFTTYGAYVYYGLLSFSTAYGLMVAFTAFTTWQAARYNREEIALLGLVGAYGIPFLISPNTGRAELLFLYISIINCGVVFISARQKWTAVGRLAMLVSWSLFIGWSVMQSSPAIKTYGLTFMLVFFVQFGLIAVAQKLLHKTSLTRQQAYQLVFNNGLFYMAALNVFSYAYTSATLTTVTGLFAVFTALQAGLFYGWKEQYAARLLAYCALGLLVLFIGFEWERFTVTLLWLLLAVAIFAVGVYRKSKDLRLTGIGLIGLTLLKLLLLDSLAFSTLQKVISYLVLGVLLLLVSFFYQKFKEKLF